MFILAESIFHLGGVAYLSKVPKGIHTGKLAWASFRPLDVVDLIPNDALALAKRIEGNIVEIDSIGKRIWLDVPFLKRENEEVLLPVVAAMADSKDPPVLRDQFRSLGWGCIDHVGAPQNSSVGAA